MDSLSSTEFRKRYAKLTEPTVVTVNGHVIGTWVPRGRGVVEGFLYDSLNHIVGEVPTEVPGHIDHVPPDRPFNTRPFTPVPKKGE